MTQFTTIQMRRGTAAQWTTANTVLASGEWGFETDTSKLKIGDGTTAWNSLNYVVGGAGSLGSVTVSGTPTAGDVLTATSGTAATWGPSKPLGTLPTDMGYKAWNFDPAATGNANQSINAGKIYLARVDIRESVSVSTIEIGVMSAGSGLANSYAGIYSSAGSRLAQTADISSSINGVPGFALDVSLTSSVTLPANSFVWVAVLIGSFVSTPNFICSAASVSSAGDLGQNLTAASSARMATYGSGLTALPASLTLGSISKVLGFTQWVALA